MVPMRGTIRKLCFIGDAITLDVALVAALAAASVINGVIVYAYL